MRKSKYTRDLLAPLVTASASFAEVLSQLRLQPTGGNYRVLKARLRLLQLSTDHFKGQGWAKGQTADSHRAVAKSSQRKLRPNSEAFVKNSPETSGWRLAKRLRRIGWEYACRVCGIAEWNGKSLRLHVDHVNGVNNDNRLENLRFLCPNCHSQTESYCKKGFAKAAR